MSLVAENSFLWSVFNYLLKKKESVTGHLEQLIIKGGKNISAIFLMALFP